MLTFTFAGDESGDVSFNFAKGASRYFVVTVIATQRPDELRGLLEKLRRDSKLPERYEFDYHIQIADLIAGAIWRRDTRSDSGAFEMIEQKIRKLIEYG